MNTQNDSPTQTSPMAPDKPRFAVWDYVNQHLLGEQEWPRAKCYDGRESWDLTTRTGSGNECAFPLSERGRPFHTEEQVLTWRQGVVIEAEPERVPVYALGTKESLCRERSLTAEEFEEQFMPTAVSNLYQDGWRPGQRNAILRLNYCPYYGP